MSRPKVAIIGVGLMGGSLGLALRRRGGWRVTGVGRRPSKLRLARRRGAIHEGTTDLAAGVRGADVVVLAVPIRQIAPFARRIRPHLKPGALVTDVGSVKGPVVRALDRTFARAGARFVGAHPMTGSEKTGVAHARADLYDGAVCVLTPGRRTPAAAARRATAFWRASGARVVRMDADAHDRWVALVSHLPHLLADALVITAGGERGAARHVRRLAAGSFRDMTRVAGADPVQWSAIFRKNAANVRRYARRFAAVLARLVAQGFSPSALAKARRLQRHLRSNAE